MQSTNDRIGRASSRIALIADCLLTGAAPRQEPRRFNEGLALPSARLDDLLHAATLPYCCVPLGSSQELRHWRADLLAVAASAREGEEAASRAMRKFALPLGNCLCAADLLPQALPKSAPRELRDSYAALRHLLHENAALHQAIELAADAIHELAKDEVEPPLDEDYPFTAFALRSVERKMELLQAAVRARLLLDQLRLDAHGEVEGGLPLELVTLDSKLRQAATRIVDEFAPGFGPTPDLGTHAYARSSSPLEGEVAQRYRSMVNRTKEEGFSIVASSYEGALHSLLACFRSRWGPFSLAAVGDAYFESHSLFESLVSSGVIRQYFKLDSAAKIDGPFDVVFAEPIANRITRVAMPALAQVVEAARRASVRAVVVDVTLDPFCTRSLSPQGAKEILLVTIDSLSKYAQCGHNVSLGGIGIVNSLPGSATALTATARELASDWREVVKRQGQHMDPRLAWTVHGNSRLYRERLVRMRHNARELRREVEVRFRTLDCFHPRSHGGKLATFFYLEIPVDIAPGDGSKWEWPLRYHGDWVSYYRAASAGTKERAVRFGSFVCRNLYVLAILEDPYLDVRVVRFSTSFGFNTTSIMALPVGPRLFLRIAAGMEDAGALDIVKGILAEGLASSLSGK